MFPGNFQPAKPFTSTKKLRSRLSASHGPYFVCPALHVPAAHGPALEVPASRALGSHVSAFHRPAPRASAVHAHESHFLPRILMIRVLFPYTLTEVQLAYSKITVQPGSAYECFGHCAWLQKVAVVCGFLRALTDNQWSELFNAAIKACPKGLNDNDK